MIILVAAMTDTEHKVGASNLHFCFLVDHLAFCEGKTNCMYIGLEWLIVVAM